VKVAPVATVVEYVILVIGVFMHTVCASVPAAEVSITVHAALIMPGAINKQNKRIKPVELKLPILLYLSNFPIRDVLTFLYKWSDLVPKVFFPFAEVKSSILIFFTKVIC
jgi:hypothetical protein